MVAGKPSQLLYTLLVVIRIEFYWLL